MNERTCACGCGRSLAGMRANAVYHSPACRMRARRAKNANKTRTRRPSRDGFGARVYLTARDLADLQAICDPMTYFHGSEQTDRLLRKFTDAADRIQAKEKGGPRGSIRRGAA